MAGLQAGGGFAPATALSCHRQPAGKLSLIDTCPVAGGATWENSGVPQLSIPWPGPSSPPNEAVGVVRPGRYTEMVWFAPLSELGQFQMSANPHVRWQLVKPTVRVAVPCQRPRTVPPGSGAAGAEQEPPPARPSGAGEPGRVVTGSLGEAAGVDETATGP